MAFGRVFQDKSKLLFLFLGCSSSFEGSPLSLLACFFLQAVQLTDPFRELKNCLTPELEGILPCVEVDKFKGIISENFSRPQWRVFFSFFFVVKQVNSIQSNFETHTHLATYHQPAAKEVEGFFNFYIEQPYLLKILV